VPFSPSIAHALKALIRALSRARARWKKLPPEKFATQKLQRDDETPTDALRAAFDKVTADTYV
jgi:hypothetical protein